MLTVMRRRVSVSQCVSKAVKAVASEGVSLDGRCARFYPWYDKTINGKTTRWHEKVMGTVRMGCRG